MFKMITIITEVIIFFSIPCFAATDLSYIELDAGSMMTQGKFLHFKLHKTGFEL